MSLDVVFLDVFLSKIFLSLETFLKKTTTLNIFDELMFNYKIKVGSVEECSPQFISFVVDLCNDLQQVLKENVVSEIKKSESTEKTETTLCLLEPVDPGFEVVTTTSSTSEIECGDGGHWEQSNSADTEPVDVVDMAVPETSFVAPCNKISEIYTCKYCNRKYRTKKKFFKHDCKSVPVPPEPGDKEYVDDPERGDISQIGARNQTSSNGDTPDFEGRGLEALLSAVGILEEWDKSKDKEEPAVVSVSEKSDVEEAPLPGDQTSLTSSHDHTYPLAKPQISEIKEGHNERAEKQKKKKTRLKECFELLKYTLPSAHHHEKSYKIVIHNAVWNIASLKRKQKEFKKEMETLTLENLAYKNELSVLKDELIAQSENVDRNNVVQAMLELKFERREESDLNSYHSEHYLLT